jgi:hypothetical protein
MTDSPNATFWETITHALIKITEFRHAGHWFSTNVDPAPTDTCHSGLRAGIQRFGYAVIQQRSLIYQPEAACRGHLLNGEKIL